MDTIQAIETRHSIRRYTDQAIGETVREQLQACVDVNNRASGLHIQLMTDEPQGFKGFIGRFNFKGVRNYIALIGPDDDRLDEKCGYYGEHLLLEAVKLGLSGCWFGGGFKPVATVIAPEERAVIAIALGYPAQEGRARKSKEFSELATIEDGSTAPEWFARGVHAALLAPTARNQQSFHLTLLAAGKDGAPATNKPLVKAESLGGALSQIDLGIVKYHFEIGAGTENFNWA